MLTLSNAVYQGSHVSLSVLEFFYPKFKALKVLEFQYENIVGTLVYA